MWLNWLVRLRWAAILSQIVTLSFAVNLLPHKSLILPLLGVVGVLAVSNIYAQRTLNRGRPVDQITLLIQLSVDIVALTSFFIVAGGPNNPFIPLYLIHVAMGSVMLRRQYAYAISILVVLAYGSLHIWHLDLRRHSHTIPDSLLFPMGQGIAWLATVTTIGVFVVGIGESLRRQRDKLMDAREATHRTDRLRAVGTLAAGAAHELNTPLATIRLRLRRIQRRAQDDATKADADVMAAQLARVSEIVEQLLRSAGDPSAGSIAQVDAGSLVGYGVHLWRKGSPIAAQFDDQALGARIEVPQTAFLHALTNLLENAREAQVETGSDAALDVRVVTEDDRVEIRITDHGPGLPTEADRVGDPFFTTKAHGTGLGVYVVRAVADGSGGGLHYDRRGDTTIATWWFPRVR